MKKLIFGLLLILNFRLMAQIPYSELPIKEHYDYILLKKNFSTSDFCVGEGTLNFILNCSGTTASTFGDGLGAGMESLIQMYRLTHDKDYLFRFIKLAFTSLNSRVTYKTGDFNFNHYEDLNSPYLGWTDFEPTTTHYQDGIALWPLAHFLYLVLVEEPQLLQQIIPEEIISTGPWLNLSISAVSTIILTEVLGTLSPHLTNYWSDGTGFKQNPTENSNPCQINQQSLSGLPLLYLGKIFGGSLWDKSILLGEFFQRTLHFEDKCLGTCTNPLLIDSPVLVTGSNDSYYWYSNGWRMQKDNDCCIIKGDDWSEHIHLIEEISHAINVLYFVEAAYELGLTYSSGNPLMTATDMVKFRNMFTKNIAVPNSTIHPKTYNFNNCTNGTNCDLGPEGDCGTQNVQNCFLKEITAYMPLYKFDNPPSGSTTLTVGPPNVYDIIMDTYQNQIMADLGNLHGAGVTLYGLAEIVRAQWDKECENLTLYNRDLTYNQNFSADHNLVINPLLSDDNHSIGQVAYALPSFSEDKFIIRSGVQSTLTAGNFILLEGEVEFEAGSEVEVTTITNNCFTGGRYAGQPNDINPEITFSEPPVEIPINSSALDNMIPSPKVFPNPSKENCTVRIFNPGEWSLRVHDVSGKLIYEEHGNSNDLLHDINITTSTWDHGIYLCKVISNNKENNSKLIVVGNK